MSSEETVTFNLEVNTEYSLDSIRRLETVLYRSLALTRRMGLPDDINEQIYQIQRLVMVIRLLHTSMIALQAASGPIGWILGGIGVASAALSGYDLWTMVSP